jgi:hypothetical protein
LILRRFHRDFPQHHPHGCTSKTTHHRHKNCHTKQTKTFCPATKKTQNLHDKNFTKECG